MLTTQPLLTFGTGARPKLPAPSAVEPVTDCGAKDRPINGSMGPMIKLDSNTPMLSSSSLVVSDDITHTAQCNG